METAILAVVVIGFVGYGAWVWYLFARVHDALVKAENRLMNRIEDGVIVAADIREVLREASRIKAVRTESPFEPRDKIQPLPSGRYVPIARRRAQAERESAGPETHDERVRENNARAMEISR